ncbi:MAG: class I SAM-dependent rRNA methyltransferase, partial [Pontixanthobacter sp.]
MAVLQDTPVLLDGAGWADYGLVDSGNGRKLERYGDYRFIRPEPQAMWVPREGNWQA